MANLVYGIESALGAEAARREFSQAVSVRIREVRERCSLDHTDFVGAEGHLQADQQAEGATVCDCEEPGKLTYAPEYGRSLVRKDAPRRENAEA
jgi:hypothetical protein